VTFGPDGTLYICDEGNSVIRTLSPDQTTVSTLAGSGVAGFRDGVGTVAQFNHPSGISIDANGVLYVADMGNNVIRRITNHNTVSRWVGSINPGYIDGIESAAAFRSPMSVTVAPSGAVFVADLGNNRIRKIVNGVVTTFAGSGSTTPVDGTGVLAAFNGPAGVAADSSGDVFVAEMGAATVRLITSAGVVSTLAGSGHPGFGSGADSLAIFNTPRAITVGKQGGVYLADSKGPHIRRLNISPAVKTVLQAVPALNTGGTVTVAPDGTIYVMSQFGVMMKADPINHTATTLASGFNNGSRMACDAAGNIYAMAGNVIERVSPTGSRSTLADVGQIVNYPCFDAAGNLYVASVNTGEQLLRISPAGVVTTINTPRQDYFKYGLDASFQFGWFHQTMPAWDHLTIDRRTGNLYVGYDEQLFRLTPDGQTLTPVYGGPHSGLPITALGQELLSGTTPLHAGAVWADPGLGISDIVCSPINGKLYITNTGFDIGAGFAQADIHRRYNIDIWDPANPGTLGFTLGSFSNFLLADASGPDVDGPAVQTTMGKPFTPALSPDGKTLYFITVQIGGKNVSVRKTNAL
jgi:hypothetical protein